jgi:hypothetical protein
MGLKPFKCKYCDRCVEKLASPRHHLIDTLDRAFSESSNLSKHVSCYPLLKPTCHFNLNTYERCVRTLVFAHMCAQNLAVESRSLVQTSSRDISVSTQNDFV